MYFTRTLSSPKTNPTSLKKKIMFQTHWSLHVSSLEELRQKRALYCISLLKQQHYEDPSPSALDRTLIDKPHLLARAALHTSTVEVAGVNLPNKLWKFGNIGERGAPIDPTRYARVWSAKSRSGGGGGAGPRRRQIPAASGGAIGSGPEGVRRRRRRRREACVPQIRAEERRGEIAQVSSPHPQRIRRSGFPVRLAAFCFCVVVSSPIWSAMFERPGGFRRPRGGIGRARSAWQRDLFLRAPPCRSVWARWPTCTAVQHGQGLVGVLLGFWLGLKPNINHHFGP